MIALMMCEYRMAALEEIDRLLCANSRTYPPHHKADIHSVE